MFYKWQFESKYITLLKIIALRCKLPRVVAFFFTLTCILIFLKVSRVQLCTLTDCPFVQVRSHSNWVKYFRRYDFNSSWLLVGLWACQLGYSLFILSLSSAAIYHLIITFGRFALLCKIVHYVSFQ